MLEQDVLEPGYGSLQRGRDLLIQELWLGQGFLCYWGNRQTENTVRGNQEPMSDVPGSEQALGTRKACKVVSCWLVPTPTVEMGQRKDAKIERTRELGKAGGTVEAGHGSPSTCAELPG